MCVALLSVSSAPIFIRLSETELGASATVFNRLAVYLLVFGLGRLFFPYISSVFDSNHPTPTTQKQWLLLASTGVFSILSLAFWAVSLQYTTVAKSMLLNNLTPLFTSLGAWLFFHRRFDSQFLLGMAIALIGAIALGLTDLNGSDDSLIGDCYALLSAVFLGTYFLVVEQLRSRFSAMTILLWRCGIGSLCLIPIVLLTEGQLFPTTPVAIFAVIGLGIICEGLGQRLLADCMDKLSSSFVALFLLLEPIISALLAWAIFLEQPNSTTWIGFAVVLTGIYIAQSSSSANQPAE